MKHISKFLLISILLVFAAQASTAQSFDSGSSGVDGALAIAGEQGVIDFDPVVLGIDAEKDGIFHFTTINVGAGTTVRLSPQHLPGPVFWLASGAVNIEGDLDLKGQNGQNHTSYTSSGSRYPAEPGAGGYPGGLGDYLAESTSVQTAGSGPGGGATANGTGGSGTHDYGSVFCVPLIGGSGGAGGLAGSYNGPANGGGGGAGGGAILIASSDSITVSGSIDVSGGKGGSGISYRGNSSAGGSGSGGEVRLVAPTVNVSGSLSSVVGDWSAAGNGRVRIEAYTRELSGSIVPAPAVGTPFKLFLPESPPVRMLITSVGGESITDPTGSFVTPDALIDTTDPVDIVVTTEQVPVGTTVSLVLLEETGIQQTLTGMVTGTLDSGTATITTTLQSGYTRGFVTATWGP